MNDQLVLSVEQLEEKAEAQKRYEEWGHHGREITPERAFGYAWGCASTYRDARFDRIIQTANAVVDGWSAGFDEKDMDPLIGQLRDELDSLAGRQ